MKIKVPVEDFARALYRVQGIADKKSTMPILAHALLSATDKQELTISATDLDIGLTGIYEANVEKPGSIAVHARQLYEIVKALPKGELELERLDNNWIELRAGSSHFKLVGMSAEEFPVLPNHQQIKTFTLPAADLLQMIDRTLFCASTDDNRHNLSGIYCEAPEKNMLRLVATDGHRLAMAEKELPSEIEIAQGVIVPRKGFQELRRIVGDSKDADAQVELGFSGTSGVLKAGSVVLSTRLVEGQFPEYQQVIPKDTNKELKVSRTALSEALKRVSLVSQNRSHRVKMDIQPTQINLIAEEPEFGMAEETIDAEHSGDPISVRFNARYLLDAMNLIRDEGVVFHLTDDLSPGIIKPLEETGFLAVVMPMRK